MIGESSVCLYGSDSVRIRLDARGVISNIVKSEILPNLHWQGPEFTGFSGFQGHFEQFYKVMKPSFQAKLGSQQGSTRKAGVTSKKL